MTCPGCSAPFRRTAHNATWFECGSELINGHDWPSLSCRSAQVEALAGRVRDLQDEVGKTVPKSGPVAPPSANWVEGEK